MDALPPLSDDEIRQFVRDGYLIKRKVMDPALCAAARDRLWAGNTSNKLRRDDKSTWVGGLPEDECTSTIDGLDDRSRYGWRLRNLSGDETLIDMLPRRVFPWLEQLLGEGEVVEPEPTSTAADPDPLGTRLRGWPCWGGKELRGVYCVLPQERTEKSMSMVDAARAGAHLDPEPTHIIAIGYIDDVPQGGGGTALFPGSHRWLTEAVPEADDLGRYCILHPPHPETGAAEFKLPQPPSLRERLKDAVPVEFYGEEGDIVLWHSKLYHSATPNYCVDPPHIRQLTLYDAYKKSVFDRVFGNGRYERGPRASPPPNIRARYGLELMPGLEPAPPRAEGPGLWADWSEAVRRAADDVGLDG